MARFIDELKRTHMCGELHEGDVDREVVLLGWVQSRRDHGGCIFIDLRDRTGLVQVMFDPALSPEAFKLADAARPEWVLGILGVVRDRGEMRNPRLPTGAIEVVAREACIFNRSDPAFPDRGRYRYRGGQASGVPLPGLATARAPAADPGSPPHDDRNSELLCQRVVRRSGDPVLKYTLGGARNFLVPSRHQAGNFYALAESPQLFKQLLMVAGYDRYFQIVKCFRDESAM